MQIVMVPTDQITPHPDNRKYFDDISGEMWDAFVDDIAQNGIREPLTVDAKTSYIIKGNQRHRAANLLDIKELPVIYVEYEDPEYAIDDLIRDNVMKRDISLFRKYQLAAVLRERIESRQGQGGGRPWGNNEEITSVQSEQKIESPRDQIAKILGLHSTDISAAVILKDLPAEKQAEICQWAKKNNPNKAALQNKIRQYKKLKEEVKELKEVKKLVKKKRAIEEGLDILEREYEHKAEDAEAAAQIMSELTEGWHWLKERAWGILTLEITEKSKSSMTYSINEFRRNLLAYVEAFQKKFAPEGREEIE